MNKAVISKVLTVLAASGAFTTSGVAAYEMIANKPDEPVEETAPSPSLVAEPVPSPASQRATEQTLTPSPTSQPTATSEEAESDNTAFFPVSSPAAIASFPVADPSTMGSGSSDELGDDDEIEWDDEDDDHEDEDEREDEDGDEHENEDEDDKDEDKDQ